MKIAKTFVIATYLLYANSAMAWGNFEQGVLSGAAGLWLWQRLNQPPVAVQQVPQGPLIGQLPTGTIPHIIINSNCRQVLAVQFDRFGNEYRYPVTVCN